MARVIDVSLPIGGNLLTWPGDPPIQVQAASRISKGDSANVSQLSLGSHTGTHIDPPFHFIDEGKRIDEIPPEFFVGEAFVADLTDVEGAVGPERLEKINLPGETSRLLLKTRNSDIWSRLPTAFPEDYVHLNPEGAAWVVSARIRLIGTDFLSIERRGAPGHPTHVTLLEREVVIVEGLDLREAEEGMYQLICLPLRIEGGDGGPARALLIQG